MHVFGTDYPTADGSCIRDYIHVVDIAKAHVKALGRLMNGEQKKRFEIFNLGTGKGLSVLQIIEAFQQYTGVPLQYTCVERRPGDIAQVYADTTLANTELGWTAERDLKEMILSAWAWEKSLQTKAVNA
jgi:UDP-glucose 4-epimerase